MSSVYSAGADTLARLKSGEPDWLAAARQRAFELTTELPAPDRALHRWRYVDPARLAAGDRPLAAPAPLVAGEPLPSSADASVVVRQQAGRTEVCLSEEARPAGVEVLDLSTAAREREEVVRRWLGRLVPATEQPFVALNSALWSGGIAILVPPRARLSKPIHVVSAMGGAGLALPRRLVVVGEDAEVVVVEEQTADGEAADAPLVHRVDEVVVGPGARFDWIVVQELPRRAVSAATSRVQLDRGARCATLFAAFGGGLAKSDLTLDLHGAGASTDVFGVVFGGGRQQFDNHTVLEHRAPDTESRLDVRVALAGRARSSATGRLSIAHEAVRSQAYQENRNLLLEKTAYAVSIPELEILTDEVQAKHGATVGPIDDEQLFYLQSRGLPRHAAEMMIVEGFFESVFGRLPVGLAQDLVRRRVQARLDWTAAR